MAIALTSRKCRKSIFEVAIALLADYLLLVSPAGSDPPHNEKTGCPVSI